MDLGDTLGPIWMLIKSLTRFFILFILETFLNNGKTYCKAAMEN